MNEIIKNFYFNIKSRKKLIIIFLVCFYFLLISIMIAAVFTDLKISDILNSPSQGFSNFMANWGEWPGYLVGIFFTAALSVFLFKKKRYFYFVLPLIACFIYGSIFAGRWFENFFVILLFNFINIAILYLIFWFTKEGTMKKILFISFIAVITAIFAALLVTAYKYIFGRVRYEDLNDNFTPWYKPNGYNNGNESFPSGHTNAACCLLPLILVPLCFNIKNKFLKVLFYVLPFLYAITMAYSRITVGAHYLSDVTFSVINYITILVIVLTVIRKIKRRRLLI